MDHEILEYLNALINDTHHHHHLYFPFIQFGYIPRDVEIVKCFKIDIECDTI